MKKKLEDIAIDKSSEFEKIIKESEKPWLLAKAQVKRGFNKENGFDEDSFIIGFVHCYQMFHCGNEPTDFKAGAECMAGQGVSFDTEMSWLDSFGFQIGWPEDTSIFDCFNEGDKVVVQIRKK